MKDKMELAASLHNQKYRAESFSASIHGGGGGGNVETISSFGTNSPKRRESRKLLKLPSITVKTPPVQDEEREEDTPRFRRGSFQVIPAETTREPRERGSSLFSRKDMLDETRLGA